MKFDPRKHQRRSIRLKGYDYSQPGAYFVTLVTYQRECIFGQIAAGQMQLNQIGERVQQQWRKIEKYYTFTELGAFVLMPNHLHGIIWIVDHDGGRGEAFAGESLAGKKSFACLNTEPGRGNQANASPQRDQSRRPKGTKPGSLAAIIQNFKTISTRQTNKAQKSPSAKLWQRDYFERVIRNQTELEAIHRYILYNPSKWESDRENPSIVGAKHLP